MQVVDTGIPGLLVFEPKVFGDDRGFFLETWNRARYENAGLRADFCQDNLSFSRRGVLRGLHMQNPRSQGKLVSVAFGEVYDVAVDLRRNSPTYGRWHGIHLTDRKKNQMYLPPGFAHGFCVLSETALFSYKCTDYYSPETEHCIAWNDPDLGIRWPLAGAPELSARDARGMRLKDLPASALVEYRAP